MSNPEDTKNEEAQEKSVLELAMEKIDSGGALSIEESDAILSADNETLNSLEKDDKGKGEQDPDSNTESEESTKETEEINYSEKYAKQVEELNKKEALPAVPSQTLEEKLKDPKFAKEYLTDLGVIEDDEDDETDYLDPKYLKGVKVAQKAIEKLNLKVSELENRVVSRDNKTKSETQKDKNVRMVDELGNEFPELKLEKGFEQTHVDYKNWFTVIGKERAEKYIADESFRAEMDTKGYKMPFSIEEYSKLTDVYKVFGKYQNSKLSTVREAFKTTEVFDRLNEKQKGKTFQDGEALVDAKLKEIEQQTKTLDTTSTQSTFESEIQISEQAASDLLDKDPATLNEKDAKAYWELVNTLTAR